MLLEELEATLEDILPAGFSIETNKKGEIIIFTNLKEEELEGELVIFDDEEVDSDFDPLDDEDEDGD